MKALPVLIFLAYSFCLLAQENQNGSLIDEDKIITDIRSKYKIIREGIEGSFTKKEYEYQGNSSEGGQLESFFDGQELRLIVKGDYGETGKTITEYYVWDQKVFFIFRQDHRYNSSIYAFEADPDGAYEAFDPQKTTIEENRYYFSGQLLIRWLDPDKHKVDAGSVVFNKRNDFLIEQFSSVVELLQLTNE